MGNARSPTTPEQKRPLSTKERQPRRRDVPPWNPHTSLVAHTAAPLACRVSRPPLAALLPEVLDPRPLHTLSRDKQEETILEDILFVLMGYEGQYIRFSDAFRPEEEKSRLLGPAYQISPGLDPSLRDLTKSILEMATQYSALEAFVEIQSREEFGLINHALCAAMRKSLKDYLVKVAQMEQLYITSPTFTLHQLHLNTIPMSQVMFQLHSLAQEILRKNAMLDEDLSDSEDGLDDVDNILEQLQEDGNLAPGAMSRKLCKGGNTLRLLTERLRRFAGDPSARSLLEGLLQDASRPYMRMLNEWLHHGGINDPHAEFLIKEQKSIKRETLEEDYTDEYWEKRYTMRDNDVPPQLEQVKDKVLLAGKYLNVVRECGGIDISTEVKDVPKTFSDPYFLDNITSAYAHANSSLLNLLVTTHALPERLRSLKYYFFLDRSDFFTYFLDLSASELRRPSRQVNVPKLQHLLELVLRQSGSIASLDPFKEDVKVEMNHVGLTEFLMKVVNVKGFEENGPGEGEGLSQLYKTPAASGEQGDGSTDDKMSGFDALVFKFAVPFPLSLVISSNTLLRYQILFRYLLSLRHLEELLVSSWEENFKVFSWTHRSSDRKVEMFKRRAWSLRGRMLVFVQCFTYYCTSEVIESNWQRLMKRVRECCEEQEHRGSDAGQPVKKHATTTVDELMGEHVDFLDTCLKECMLMNSKLLKVRVHDFLSIKVVLSISFAIATYRSSILTVFSKQLHSKLISAVYAFTTYTPHFTRYLFAADPSLAGTPRALNYLAKHFASSRSTAAKGSNASTNPPKQQESHNSDKPLSLQYPNIPQNLLTHDPTRLPKIEDMLEKIEYNFNRHLKIFLDALDYYAATETVALSRLCAQLSMVSKDRGERNADVI